LLNLVKKSLFVATKKQAKDIKEAAQTSRYAFRHRKMVGWYVNQLRTVSKSIKKMQTIDKMATDGTYANINKKEKLMLEREKAKLFLFLVVLLIWQNYLQHCSSLMLKKNT
jgi:small subunit ribosomal protein S2